MASAWEKVPKEILEIIFKNLRMEYYKTNFDLRECTLVCRGWTSTAQEVIFSAIYLTSEEEFERLIYTIAFHPTLTRFVKRIDYYYNEHTSKKHIAHLAIIGEFFTNLEEFDATGFTNDTFYELFCNLVKDGKFPYLKEFPDSHDVFQDKLCASSMISHGKNSITTISLFRHDETSRNDYRLMCDALPEFSKLYKLDFTVISEIPQNVIEYLETTTRSVTLREVYYTFDFPDTSTNFQLINFQPALNIKSLVTQIWRALGVDHVDYILYLMKKFPNLESLTLVFHDQWRIDTLESGSKTSVFISQLFGYLSRLLESSISFYCIDENNIGQLFKLFFHSIRNEEGIPVHLELSSDFSDNEPSLVYIDLARKERHRNISMQLPAQKYTHFAYSFLEEFGHRFEEMSIEGETAVGLANELNHISKYCASLKSLTIRRQSNVDYNDESQADYKVHKNLKKLTMHEFSSELFPFISCRFPCIETVNIGCRYDPEADEMRRFSEHGNLSDVEEEEENKIFYLDVQDYSFHHLVIDISVNEEKYDARLKNVYIKVITRNGGETRYIHILAPSLPDEPYPKKRQIFELADDATEAGYLNTIGDLYYLHFEVNCESVEKISVTESSTNFDLLEIKVDILRYLKI